MDNLAAHKSSVIVDRLEEFDIYVLYTPSNTTGNNSLIL